MIIHHHLCCRSQTNRQSKKRCKWSLCCFYWSTCTAQSSAEKSDLSFRAYLKVKKRSYLHVCMIKIAITYLGKTEFEKSLDVPYFSCFITQHTSTDTVFTHLLLTLSSCTGTCNKSNTQEFNNKISLTSAVHNLLSIKGKKKSHRSPCLG